MEEVWKDVLGYEDFYTVSNLGRMKNKTREIVDSLGHKKVYRGRLKTLNPSTDGYVNVTLVDGEGNKTTNRLHRIVIESFTGELIPDGMHVNHIDGNKANNRLDNLEICTPSENLHHAMETGLLDRYDERKSKLKPEQVLEICRTYEETKCKYKVLAEKFDISEDYVGYILKGGTWSWLTGIEYPSKTARLMDKERAEIVELYNTGDFSQQEISEMFGITQSAVSYTLRNFKKKGSIGGN